MRGEVVRSGVPLSRVVAVLAELGQGRVQIGSGYLVRDRLVITAEHCTRDKTTGAAAVSLAVVGAADGVRVTATVHAAAASADVALLELADRPIPDTSESPAFARVDRSRSGQLLDCVAIGFPAWQLDPVDGQRSTTELHGTIRLTESADAKHLLLRDQLLEGVASRGTSPWAGMSGALVFYQGRGIGVVVQHNPAQGNSSVRLAPFDVLAERADAGTRAVADALGLPAAAAMTSLSGQAALYERPQFTVGSPETALFQLPPEGTALVGREAELSRIRDHLVGHDAACVVLTGMGGAGKSALALRAAHSMTDRYPDGQLYIDMRGDGSAPLAEEAALAYLLLSLGLAEEVLSRSLEHMVALYRSRTARMRLLVVLDNVADEEQVRHLRLAGPRTATLVTARRPVLTLGNALQLQVPPLPPAASTALLTAFVGDREDVGKIAAMAGGNPLALSIVGAQWRRQAHRSADDVFNSLTRTDNLLDKLSVGDRAVRASIRFTYDGLSRAEQVAFERLCLPSWRQLADMWVFPLLGYQKMDDATVLLDNLAEAQLLEPMGGGYYRMHDLVQGFGRELLGEHRRDPAYETALRVAIAEYVQWRHGTVQGWRDVVTPTIAQAKAEQGDRVIRLVRANFDIERSNLAGDLFLLNHEGLHGITTMLAEAVVELISRDPDPLELRLIGQLVTAAATITKDPAATVEGLLAQHRALHMLGESFASDLLAEAEALAESTDDRNLRARVRLEQFRRGLESGIPVAEPTGLDDDLLPSLRVQVLDARAMSCVLADDLAEAITHLTTAAHIVNENPSECPAVLHADLQLHAGRLLFEAGDPDESLETVYDAMNAYAELHHRDDSSIAGLQLALALSAAGRHGQALTFFDLCEPYFARRGYLAAQSLALRGTVVAKRALRRRREAKADERRLHAIGAAAAGGSEDAVRSCWTDRILNTAV
ncbi:trypsin-like peptidase domain-containing protein [Actinoplanes sp. CA-030573]|uniref:trypsin-like peptidase domain-containing protein n=1 Tax=Actinoplanes sp. CA-030573 TaxID=3239898 RepID=UPI003D944340